MQSLPGMPTHKPRWFMQGDVIERQPCLPFPCWRAPAETVRHRALTWAGCVPSQPWNPTTTVHHLILVTLDTVNAPTFSTAVWGSPGFTLSTVNLTKSVTNTVASGLTEPITNLITDSWNKLHWAYWAHPIRGCDLWSPAKGAKITKSTK